MTGRALQWAGSGLGLGFLPAAPGTWGSLGGAALWWLTLPLGLPVQVLLLALAAVPAAWVCGACAQEAGERDPSFVVLDEILGMYLALLFLKPSWWWAGAAFVLFRVLDIAKPWPVNRMERCRSEGPAILLDDLVAGAISGMTLLAVRMLVT